MAPKLYQTKYGIKLWLFEENNYFNMKILGSKGPYQARNLNALKTWQPHSRVTLDVGTNVGMNVIEYAKFSDTVYGWELVPETFELAEKNLLENDIRNAKIYNCGLGDKIGKVNIKIQPNNDGLNSVARPKDKNQGPEVGITMIDSYGLKNVDIIKIDVEGYELKVLQGARNTLIHSRPILQLEIFNNLLRKFGNSAQELYDFCRELDYVPFNYKGERLDFTYQKIKRICDTFFVPNEKIHQIVPVKKEKINA